MNNYTHSYSEYVDHILNKSPSKATYTFSKAPRFPQKRDGAEYQQIDPFTYRNTYEDRDLIDRDKKSKSPVRSQRFERSYYGNNKRDNFDTAALARNVEEILNPNSKLIRSRSKSKSPLRSKQQLERNQRSPQRQLKVKKISNERSYIEASPSIRGNLRQSPTKSPKRESNRVRYSPNKTFTQHLQEIDHISKNITINGYYPTGVELSPTGKTPISTFRNTESHKFGKSSSKQRYRYMVKSEDNLGPGYYESFSEFGSTHQKR